MNQKIEHLTPADLLCQALLADSLGEQALLPSEEELRARYQSDLLDQKLAALPAGKKRTTLLRRISRMAASVAVASVVVFSGLMTSQAFRSRFLNLLFDIQPTHTTITVDGSTQEAQQILADATLNQQVYQLSWLPEGYTLQRRTDYHTMIIEEYAHTDGRILSFDQHSLHTTVALDTEQADVVKHITVGGFDCLYVEKRGVTQMLWQNENAMFLLFGEQISEREIRQVAQGVVVDVASSRRYSPAERPMQVGWIPDDFTLTNEVTPTSELGIRRLDYTRPDGQRLTITQQRYNDAQWPNWEDWPSHTEVEVNGEYGMLLSREGEDLLFWDDYRFLYTVSSSGLDHQEMLAIAQSITLPEIK